MSIFLLGMTIGFAIGVTFAVIATTLANAVEICRRLHRLEQKDASMEFTVRD